MRSHRGQPVVAPGLNVRGFEAFLEAEKDERDVSRTLSLENSDLSALWDRRGRNNLSVTSIPPTSPPSPPEKYRASIARVGISPSKLRNKDDESTSSSTFSSSSNAIIKKGGGNSSNNKSIVGGKENNDRSSSSSSSNRNNHGTMHDAFLDMLKALEDRYLELKSKPLRIRVERWVSKLAYHVENPTWVKERNAYAAALLDAVTRNTFRDPFHALPPEGGLPALPDWIRRSFATGSNGGSGSGGNGGSHASMNKSLQQQRAHREPRSRSEGAAAARRKGPRAASNGSSGGTDKRNGGGGGDGDTLIEQSTGELLGRFPSSFVQCDAP
jgi:hypothetical protein